MMRRSLIALVCVAFLFYTSCSSCSIIDNKVYQNCYGSLIPCANNTYNIGSPTRYINTTYTYNFYTDAWDDVSISMANAKTPAANAPTWRSYLQSEVPAFSATQVNVLYFSAQLPHSYKEGSDIEFHIHVAYPDANAGNSTWYFTYSWANVDENFPVASSLTKQYVAAPGVANRHQSIELIASINGTGKKISSVLLCSVQRLGNDGADNYPSEIYLVSGDFHIQKDTIGSKTKLAK